MPRPERGESAVAVPAAETAASHTRATQVRLHPSDAGSLAKDHWRSTGCGLFVANHKCAQVRIGFVRKTRRGARRHVATAVPDPARRALGTGVSLDWAVIAAAAARGMQPRPVAGWRVPQSTGVAEGAPWAYAACSLERGWRPAPRMARPRGCLQPCYHRSTSRGTYCSKIVEQQQQRRMDGASRVGASRRGVVSELGTSTFDHRRRYTSEHTAASQDGCAERREDKKV